MLLLAKNRLCNKEEVHHKLKKTTYVSSSLKRFLFFLKHNGQLYRGIGLAMKGETCICSWMRSWLTLLANITAQPRKRPLMCTFHPVMSISFSSCVERAIWFSLVKRNQLLHKTAHSKVCTLSCVNNPYCMYVRVFYHYSKNHKTSVIKCSVIF